MRWLSISKVASRKFLSNNGWASGIEVSFVLHIAICLTLGQQRVVLAAGRTRTSGGHIPKDRSKPNLGNRYMAHGIERGLY